MAAPSITPATIANAVASAQVGAKFGQFTLTAKTLLNDDGTFLDYSITVTRGGNSWTGFFRVAADLSTVRLYSVVDGAGVPWTNSAGAWLKVVG